MSVVGNPITLGGGGSSALDYASGYEAVWRSSTILPHEIVLNPINLTLSVGDAFNRAYESGKGTQTTMILTLNIQQTTPFSLYRFLYQAYGIKEVTITGNLQYCTSYQKMIDYGRMTKIDMEFDFSSCANSDACDLGMNLSNITATELHFKPNTLLYSASFSGFSYLNDATLVALANCLRGDAVSQTLTLNSGQKDRCDAIMGTVSLDTDTQTYYVFTADPSGNTSLTNFITTTKGWTLA